jgi:hypothetical protein
MLERHDENLAVANQAGTGRRGDRLDGLGGAVGRHCYLDTNLGQEIHDVFGAPVDFGMAFLPPVAHDLGDGHSGNADRRQGLPDIVQLERLYDGDDELHGRRLLPGPSRRTFSVGRKAFGRAGVRVLKICVNAFMGGARKQEREACTYDTGSLPRCRPLVM